MKRSLVDRLIQFVKPTALASFAPPPAEMAPGLWTLERRLGMSWSPSLPTSTTIIRLPSGGLLVVSPPPLKPGGLEAIDSLGTVEEIVVPNSFHYLNAAGFHERYRGATLRVVPGLRERVAAAPRGEELTRPAPPSWGTVVDLQLLGPVRGICEAALLHRPSSTLIVTDLAFHMVRHGSGLERAFWHLNGIPAGFGPSRTARMLLLRDRTATADFLRRILEWPFERVLVSHGEPLETDAVAEFRRAFADYLGQRRSG